MARLIAIAAALLAMTPVAAMGFDPMTATVRVSSGQLYDYVVIGEHPKATDGFDNAYDIISPGNLNADMGEPYISVVVPHPEWKPPREMRSDIRSPAVRTQWEIVVSSSLANGTPLVVTVDLDQSRIAKTARLTLEGKSRQVVLDGNNYKVPAPGPGVALRLLLVAEQE